MLLNITSTDDELLRIVNMTSKWMEIDQNFLRTGTAIGSRASPEH